MSNDLVIYLSKKLLFKASIITGPIMCASVLCGLLISFFQIVTQIQDNSLSAVPKMLTVAITLSICGSWMLTHLLDFARQLILMVPEYLK